MRDITQYEKDYLNGYDFEKYLVRYRRKNITDTTDVSYTHSMLEIGCGLEPLFDYLEGNWKDYIVVEPGDNFYTNAEHIAKKYKNINVRHGFAENILPSLDKKFDLIIASSVLHEVEKPLTFLNSVKPVMDRNSILHINVPNANSIHNQLAVKMGLIEDIFAQSKLANQMQRHSTFDTSRLIRFVRGCGFEVINTGGYFLKPFTYSQLSSMLDKEIITEKVLDALYELGQEQPHQAAEIYVNVQIA